MGGAGERTSVMLKVLRSVDTGEEMDTRWDRDESAAGAETNADAKILEMRIWFYLDYV